MTRTVARMNDLFSDASKIAQKLASPSVEICLPRIGKIQEEDHLLKHIHEMVEIPEVFQTPEFMRLFLLAKIGNFTPEEYKEYQKSLDKKRARAEGILEGEIRGRAEGREEARLENAAKFKQLGVSVDIISQATGLPIETIEKL